ncbi:MAG: hypothetical protein M1814_004873 [Vezdaea aestivalis]|nr:MAG: hypothetical protein M1814_004873 [Vezdaea aestivalis]
MSSTIREAPTEQTPLIAIVRVSPPRQRYTHHRIRRCSTFLISLMLIIGALVFLFPFVFHAILHATEHLTGHHIHGYLPWSKPYPAGWPHTKGISLDDLIDIMTDNPDAGQIREYSQYYTSGPHLVGKNLSQALWTRDRWREFGIENTNLASYDIFLNYHVDHRLALYEKEAGNASVQDQQWTLKFEAGLEEDVLEEDSTSGLDDRIPTYHAYSANGNVTAPYVFVNYGTYQDYDDLIKANITLKDKIALVKYGRIYRGLKVTRAEELGMAGVIMYSDPGDDGNVTAEMGEKEYPHGKARQPSSVQRGSVALLNRGMGDPTTPGYASKPGVPRKVPGHEVPKIPSIPISYQDALPLLKALNGHGPNVSSFNKYWNGGGLGYKGVEYNIGPSPDSLAINLFNQQEYVTTPIWNVIGVINGTFSDEVVVIGNHRDAWIAGGAGDPNSGTAVLAEMVRSFGLALQTGWKPRRTIVFASWDGEEYALLGSSEWVEGKVKLHWKIDCTFGTNVILEYLPWLSGAAVAYLNVDVAVSGPNFIVASNPLMNKLVDEIVKQVSVENENGSKSTVESYWDHKFKTLGSGSDFAAFQHFAGVPSFDLSFHAGPMDAVYHYHSNYDSFHWMDTFGDPSWKYHVAMTKTWSLLALACAEIAVIPFKLDDYSSAIKTYVRELKEKISAARDDNESLEPLSNQLSHLEHAAYQLHETAKAVEKDHDDIRGKVLEEIPWWKWWETVALFFRVLRANQKIKQFDRNFLYAPGLDERHQFKHVLYAPGFWTGYAGVTLPGLRESIEARNWTNAKHWSEVIQEKIYRARKSLE